MNKRIVPRRGDDDDEDDGGLLSALANMQEGPFRVHALPQSMKYVCRIDGPFKSVKQFENIVAVLENAGPDDIVEIKLSTPGGSIDAVIPLMSAFMASQAIINVHAVSSVCSAGTFLLMLADNVFINPYATIMFHEVSFGAGGQGSRVKDRVDFIVDSSTKLVEDMYEGFLTEPEIQSLLDGKEFWMGKDDFDKRYAERQQRLDAEEAEKQ